jgi:hypothetical protein
MKNKLKIIVLALLLPYTSKEQSYISLPDSNATWITIEESSLGKYYHEYGLNLTKDDTIINSISYIKVFKKGTIDFQEYVGAFREDTTGSTFFIYLNDTSEYLLFDFSKNTGDTLNNIAFSYYNELIGIYNLKVDSVLLSPSGSLNLKCMYLSFIEPFPPNYNGNSVVWVERIGSLNGGIFNDYLCGLSMHTLRCMSANDTIFYFQSSNDCSFSEQITLSYDPGTCSLPVSVPDIGIKNNRIQVSPNPFFNNLNLRNLPNNQINISIFNFLGEMIYHEELDSIMSNHLIYMDCKPGVYLIIIASKGKIISILKIIKI